jgi:uncharacterized protein YgbK (DUF1537 family)
MPPPMIARELEPVGAFFARLAPPVLHYKVCSTFDSAPAIGSIGTAVRALRPHVANPLVAIVGGQPSLGRYCAFSNLFAAAGRGGAVERLDRHPTMRQHPTTPMHEADLRRHLGLQGLDPSARCTTPCTVNRPPRRTPRWQALLARRPAAVLLDLADAAHLAPVGRLLWDRAQAARLLAVGASSVAQALVAHWQATGQLGTQVPAMDCSPKRTARCSRSPAACRRSPHARSALPSRTSPSR